MSVEYASNTTTPGCIYRSTDPGPKTLRFEPIGAFILTVFGELSGGVNVYGIRKELLSLDNADALWIEFAPSDEIYPGNAAAMFDVPANLVCEARFGNENETVWVFWDYGTQLTLDRKQGL